MPRSAGLLDQAVEVGHGPQVGLDGAEIGDVVAPVGVGRHRDRAEPDAVDTQPLEMVEVVDDPLDVSRPVTVAVGEGAGVDLIEDGALPPRLGPVVHFGVVHVGVVHVWGRGFQFCSKTQHTTSGGNGAFGVLHWLDGGLLVCSLTTRYWVGP